MLQRTFRQYAQGFGSAPVQAVVTIDDVTVFSGTVNTLNQPAPPMSDSGTTLDNLAWSWQGDAAYQGTRAITVAVTGSTLVLGQTLANSPYNDDGALWGQVWSQEINGVRYFDPFTDVRIDGIAQSTNFTAAQVGQRWWRIPAGSTWTATMNIKIWDHHKLSLAEIAEAYAVAEPS